MLIRSMLMDLTLSLNDHPYGQPLISGVAIVDTCDVATSVTTVGYSGVSGGHGGVVANGQCSHTGRADAGCDSNAAGTGTNASDGAANTDGSCGTHTDSTRADSGSGTLATDTAAKVTGEGHGRRLRLW
jgi:hypothetical protein